MALEIIFTLFLVLLNGFFVAAEFAIVKVRASSIDVKISQGSKRAKTAKHIVDHLDSYLSATQLGITLASLALGWVGEDVMAAIITKAVHFFNASIAAETAHTIAAPIGFAVITIAHIVFGEQAPKMIAIKHSLATAMVISLPLRIFVWIFSPFIWFLNKFSNIVLRITGINTSMDEGVHTEEELRLILTESEEGGAIKSSEHDLIQNVFDFDDRNVKQVMIPQNRVSSINAEMGNDLVVKKIIDEGFSRLPVYSGDINNVIGIIHSRDLLKAVIEKKFVGINDILRPVHFIPENMKINDLLRDFQKKHIQFAVVTDEFGATAGVVTMEDIIEELVGEIQDEHDDEKPNIEKISDSEYLVKALVSIGDANEGLPIVIPENPEYDTISGYINKVFGRIPAVNEKRNILGYEVTILARKKQNIELVKFKVLPTVEEN